MWELAEADEDRASKHTVWHAVDADVGLPSFVTRLMVECGMARAFELLRVHPGSVVELCIDGASAEQQRLPPELVRFLETTAIPAIELEHDYDDGAWAVSVCEVIRRNADITRMHLNAMEECTMQPMDAITHLTFPGDGFWDPNLTRRRSLRDVLAVFPNLQFLKIDGTGDENDWVPVPRDYDAIDAQPLMDEVDGILLSTGWAIRAFAAWIRTCRVGVVRVYVESGYLSDDDVDVTEQSVIDMFLPAANENPCLRELYVDTHQLIAQPILK